MPCKSYILKPIRFSDIVELIYHTVSPKILLFVHMRIFHKARLIIAER